MSGMVEPDTYVVHQGPSATSSACGSATRTARSSAAPDGQDLEVALTLETSGAQRVLSDEQILELARLAHGRREALRHAAGHRVGAWPTDKTWLVQSRPITTLPPRTSRSARRRRGAPVLAARARRVDRTCERRRPGPDRPRPAGPAADRRGARGADDQPRLGAGHAPRRGARDRRRRDDLPRRDRLPRARRAVRRRAPATPPRPCATARSSPSTARRGRGARGRGRADRCQRPRRPGGAARTAPRRRATRDPALRRTWPSPSTPSRGRRAAGRRRRPAARGVHGRRRARAACTRGC